MAIPDATKLASCQAAAAKGDWLTVFTGASGTTGANEATNAVRAQCTWTDGTNKVTSSEVNVKCGSAGNTTTFKEAGAFSAKTGGTFAGGGPFTGGDVVVSGAGSVDLTLVWS